jgi:hypothetical protein
LTAAGRRAMIPPMATKCSIERERFKSAAKPVQVEINGTPCQAEVKEFSTGSFGWNLNTKVTIQVDGVPVSVQVGLNLTVVGSKETPK